MLEKIIRNRGAWIFKFRFDSGVEYITVAGITPLSLALRIARAKAKQYGKVIA